MSELDELRAAIEALETQRTDRSGVAGAHLHLGTTPCPCGLLEGTSGHAQQTLTIGEETGDLSMVHIGRGMLGYWHAQRDELEPAAEHGSSSAANHQRTGAMAQTARRIYQLSAHMRLMRDEAGAARAEAKASATAREQRLNWLHTPTPKATAAAGQGSER